MSDTTLIGILAAAAVTVVLILLFVRRRSTPPEALNDSLDDGRASAPQLDSSGDAEPAREALSEARPEQAKPVQVKAAVPEAVAAPEAEVEQREEPPEPAKPGATQAPEAAVEEFTGSALPEEIAGLTPEPEAPPVEDSEEEKAEATVSAFKRGLSNTRGGFISRLANLFKSKPVIDSALLDEIEEILITADIGVKTSDSILEALRLQAKAHNLESEDAVWDIIRGEAQRILSVDAKPVLLDKRPSLILVAGVNGVGKTTTIGKLAAKYAAEGRRVLLAAGDTYRAAAVLQLEVWGQRVGCPVVKGKEGADPGSVIFDAIARARDEGYDLVIADTAGRLHTKQPLMDELKKVDRTVTKALGGRNADEILLVLDATTGQNAVQQMHMFRGALGITGVVLTKLDGTAKGGVILGIVDEHKVPVRFVGLGERVEDLREFSADGFVKALFERPSEENMAA